MRLWHYKLIPFLPRTQLIAQWRELNSIYKNQQKHILINYIYSSLEDGTPRVMFNPYCNRIRVEMVKRGYKINHTNHNLYFGLDKDFEFDFYGLKLEFERKPCRVWNFPEHDDEYLQICIYNLKEKYIRGQKDFSKEQYDRIMETF